MTDRQAEIAAVAKAMPDSLSIEEIEALIYAILTMYQLDDKGKVAVLADVLSYILSENVTLIVVGTGGTDDKREKMH